MGILKKKNINKNRKRFYNSYLRFKNVELEGIEPSSKQGINKPSTYLVTF